MQEFKQRIAALLVYATLVVLAGCGGTGASQPNYTVGGSVTGLAAGDTLVLANNGGDDLTITQSGGFAFATPLTPGSTYQVTVMTQPKGQSCTVTGGSGNVAAPVSVLGNPSANRGNVITVGVNCTSAGPFTVGGTVAGLLATRTLVLLDNASNPLTVAANGSFVFTAALAGGSAYAVTVATQPAGQSCAVTNGSDASIAANVTDVSVSCSVESFNVGGSVSGLTGTLVVSDNGSSTLTITGNGAFTFNTPIASGSTYAAAVTSQPAGENCTLANGSGTVVAAAVTNISIVCTANVVSTPGFTWEGGPGSAFPASGGAGVYGTKGVASPSNLPPPRAAGLSWTDTAGNFWLFGGTASIVGGTTSSYLDDLWKYSPTTGEWTWVSGSNTVATLSVYGTQGTAAAGNGPGSHGGGSVWVDANGNFWLFGGYGCNGTTCSGGFLNDLWMFSPTTGLWTWEGGSQTYAAAGVYGSPGVAAAANFPGSRSDSSNWTDLAGNLWLLGGVTYDVNDVAAPLNDLWKYSPTTHQWTWVGGSNSATGNVDAVRGTRGQASAGNWPGAIYTAASVTDASGNFWMFGGHQTLSNGAGPGNDIWEYSPATGLWACWTSGTGLPNQASSYGTQGTPSLNAFPGGRSLALSWTDASGNVWIFGGEGTEQATKGFGDLWKFTPSSGLWAWIAGSTSANDPAPVWGTLGVPATNNFTGSRVGAFNWKDSSGNFWLFSGGNNDGSAPSGNALYGDLWKITP
jgi:N-acetylneuraminic acid mutarotase